MDLGVGATVFARWARGLHASTTMQHIQFNQCAGDIIPPPFRAIPDELPLSSCLCVGQYCTSGLASGCRTTPQRRDTKAGLSVWHAILADVASAAVRAWPLAALGVSRLVVTKGLHYQEHVSEYGIHWNFFATLFCMRIVVVPMNRLRPARLRLWLALLAVCVYQWLLVRGGLSEFIVDAPRNTLFSMNREGVLGLVGFVAIYFIAKELGSQIWARRRKNEKVILVAV